MRRPYTARAGRVKMSDIIKNMPDRTVRDFLRDQQGAGYVDAVNVAIIRRLKPAYVNFIDAHMPGGAGPWVRAFVLLWIRARHNPRAFYSSLREQHPELTPNMIGDYMSVMYKLFSAAAVRTAGIVDQSDFADVQFDGMDVWLVIMRVFVLLRDLIIATRQ